MKQKELGAFRLMQAFNLLRS